MATQAVPPPPSWRIGVQNRQVCRFPHHVTDLQVMRTDPQVTRKGWAWTRKTRESRDQCGGGGGETLFLLVFFN
jgi:hypothetical protein